MLRSFFSQVFFVIQFHHPEKVSTLGKIEDADPMLSCDLMDGRDAFLTLAREKHWEFSSLRRAKFSTMAMLVELHNQGTERFVYTCNMCKRHVETRYHCTECEVSKTTFWWYCYLFLKINLSTLENSFKSQLPVKVSFIYFGMMHFCPGEVQKLLHLLWYQFFREPQSKYN